MIMEKIILESLLRQGKNQQEIANIICKSKTTVRYWLEKHELLHKRTYQCKCGEKDRSKFLQGRWHTCKKCRALLATERLRSIKKQALAYKGGKCEICGYDKCQAALDFHHKQPSEKDPRWKIMRSWTFAKLKNELDKCMLVCKNCHAEIHYSSGSDGETLASEARESEFDSHTADCQGF